MGKPTVFFSHSSKDRESLVLLKEMLSNKTGNTLDIFLSSDGQSIPFGTNWVNNIEQGLNNATIMFVFITPNSIVSNWIYFESGFAYSKGIDVIPVGITIDICNILPPLNLLQGFNINSAGSLNNIIHIINKKFDYSFEKLFTDEEYKQLVKSDDYNNHKWHKLVENVVSSLFSYSKSNGNKIEIDENIFEKIKQYFINNKYDISLDDKQGILLANGYKLSKHKDDNSTQYLIAMSPLYFSKSFQILKDILKITYLYKDIHFIKKLY